MFTLSTHIELPIAHRLPEAYSGLCVGNVSRDGKIVFEKDSPKIIHGHNYNIVFNITTNVMNDDFMVMDFKKVKKIIHREMDKYDHSLILKKGDDLINYYSDGFDKANIDLNNTRLFIWEQSPTAEYMSYKWYNDFKKLFEDEGIVLSNLSITVEETSHNSVTYTEIL